MSALMPTRPTPRNRGGKVTLPWWAVVLPAIAFAALLLLILDPSRAHASTGGPGVIDHLGHIRRSLPF